MKDFSNEFSNELPKEFLKLFPEKLPKEFLNSCWRIIQRNSQQKPQRYLPEDEKDNFKASFTEISEHIFKETATKIPRSFTKEFTKQSSNKFR